MAHWQGFLEIKSVNSPKDEVLGSPCELGAEATLLAAHNQEELALLFIMSLTSHGALVSLRAGAAAEFTLVKHAQTLENTDNHVIVS